MNIETGYIADKVLNLQVQVTALKSESDWIWNRLFSLYKEAGGILDFSHFKERELAVKEGRK